MANGYVPRFGRPNPFLQEFQRQQQQQQQQQQQPRQRPLSSDPNALFSQQQQAQCLFPEYFPAEGPNIFQRFWIWLFGPPVRLILACFKLLRAIYTGLRTADYTTLQRGELPLFLTYFGVETARTEELMSAIFTNRWSLLIGLVVIVALSLGAWFFSPKGENQTVWRSTLILSFASCYIMWAITFMAQWHPLIEPRMTELRAGYRAGS